jgi:hypothetical protein
LKQNLEVSSTCFDAVSSGSNRLHSLYATIPRNQDQMNSPEQRVQIRRFRRSAIELQTSQGGLVGLEPTTYVSIDNRSTTAQVKLIAQLVWAEKID